MSHHKHHKNYKKGKSEVLIDAEFRIKIEKDIEKFYNSNEMVGGNFFSEFRNNLKYNLGLWVFVGINECWEGICTQSCTQVQSSDKV